MSDLISASDPSTGDVKSNFDPARIAEVKAWLVSQFDAAGKDVPEFEYTPRSVAHLHALATISQAKTQAAGIVAADLRQKAAEYRSQAARIREILENVGLAQESLSPNAVTSAQVLANVANLLNIRDTEMTSFLVAMGDISLRKTGVEEKRAKVQKESKVLLEYTRKALARLTYLKRTLTQLDDEVASCEAQTLHWKTNLAIMDSKERQYLQQHSNYKVATAGIESGIRFGNRRLLGWLEAGIVGLPESRWGFVGESPGNRWESLGSWDSLGIRRDSPGNWGSQKLGIGVPKIGNLGSDGIDSGFPRIGESNRITIPIRDSGNRESPPSGIT
ncbi:AUGMIN subunit 1-like isoform X1 [Tasmannia lanceolata]|uniref:AUGMIN subunit 1-like isoform X1 n=1 Tax=Tasmannia lanceolata TaxID=3420 RepID=UPI004063D768